MKCTYKKVQITENSSPSKSSPEKKSPTKSAKNEDEGDGDSSSELAEDSERDEDKKDDVSVRTEFHPLHAFKDLYKCTPIYNFMH